MLMSDEIAIVVSDIQMPNMSGVELAHRIRKARSDVPVLLISGSEFDRLGLARVLEVASAFLPKSEVPAGLVDEVERLLGEAG